MTAAKKRPRVGDETWEVEWVSKMAFYPDSTDVDRDRCESSYRYFDTYEEALAFAAKTWPETTDKFGIVEIMPKWFVPYEEEDADIYPHLGFWESCGDVKIISDDTGIPE